MAGKAGAMIVQRISSSQPEAIVHPELAARKLLHPGSLLKPFTAAWLLQQQLLSPQHRVACDGVALAVADALAASCNAWFEEASAVTEPAAFRRGLQQLGLQNEWREPPSRELFRLALSGRQFIRVTPLHMMQAWRKLAQRRNEASLAPVFAGLAKAADRGTARLAGAALLAKTGTSVDGAWFAAMTPAQQPEWLVLVWLPRGTGGADAAPLARLMLEQLPAASPYSRDHLRVRFFSQSRLTQLGVLSPDGRPVALPADLPVSSRIITAQGEQTSPWPLSVRQEGDRYTVDALLPLEDYVAQVVDAEAGEFRAAAALEAMAITARTWALAHRNRHHADGHELCDSTHCQDLSLRPASPKARAAAQRTKGLLLWQQGQLIDAAHHAHCGGVTQAGVSSPACGRQPEWQSFLSQEQLRRVFPGWRSLRVAQQRHGRVDQVLLNDRPVSEEWFRLSIGRTLGWHHLKSNQWRVEQQRNGLLFMGRGRGHGLGLCQSGANELALTGATREEILQTWFSGATLSRSGAGIRWHTQQNAAVEAAAPTQAQAQLLALQMRTALQEAGRRCQCGTTKRIELRLYPDVASFRNEAGDAGSTAAALRGPQLLLQPKPSTALLLHEAMHFLLEANTSRSHPRWFREGLVLHLVPESRSESDEYRSALRRVKTLASRFGNDALLRWWREGLPTQQAKEQ
jgi:stage II sporulation protein D